MAGYYFYDGRQKKGPFSAQQIRDLAASGNIGPDTWIETIDGQTRAARELNGLVFRESIPNIQQSANVDDIQSPQTAPKDKLSKEEKYRISCKKFSKTIVRETRNIIMLNVLVVFIGVCFAMGKSLGGIGIIIPIMAAAFSYAVQRPILYIVIALVESGKKQEEIIELLNFNSSGQK